MWDTRFRIPSVLPCAAIFYALRIMAVISIFNITHIVR